MAQHFYTLVFLTLHLFSSAYGNNTSYVSVDIRFDKLEILLMKLEGLKDVIYAVQRKQDDIKQDQEDLKKHTLKRLEAIEEKTEWCLSSGQQGAHPLNDRMTQIEEHLTRIENLIILPKDCVEVYNRGFNKSGVYKISPDGITKMNVYCEQELDGGGWTVFQRRQDGSENFFRNWEDYKTGFGKLTGEFWLGNHNLHLLTKDHDQKLKIELISPQGETAYADYSTFWIENENLKYKIKVSGFSGADPPGDSLVYHNGNNFSTKDRDYDKDSKNNCASVRIGAWWYNACTTSNLNGPYGSTAPKNSLNWYSWKGESVSLTGTKMMVKKRL